MRCFIEGNGYKGIGHYLGKKMMVVEEGTIVNGKAIERMIPYREKLIRMGVLDRNGVFKKPYMFSSVSMAAGVITGQSRNGWITWKDRNGVLLEDRKIR